tara:strand:- start:96 stop:353 length:258 start_codon:yes stop_codon:yes gene_type:complete
MDIIDFICFFLFFWWLMLIIYKVNLPTKLYNRFSTKFIDELTNCEFCMESHTATLLAIILAVIEQNHLLLLYAPMSAALSNLLKR